MMNVLIEHLIGFMLAGAGVGIMLLCAFGVVTAGTFVAGFLWHGSKFCFQVLKRRKWLRENRRASNDHE